MIDLMMMMMVEWNADSNSHDLMHPSGIGIWKNMLCFTLL
jgi:hypothetical protein